MSEVPIRLDYHGKHVSMEQVYDLRGRGKIASNTLFVL